MDHDSPAEPDGGAVVELDRAELYVVVLTAIEDAMLKVIGTLLLIGIGLLLVWAGATTFVTAELTGVLIVGVAVALLGIYLAATTLELVPSLRSLV